MTTIKSKNIIIYIKIKILNKREMCLFNFLNNSNSIKNPLNTDFWREYFSLSLSKNKKKVKFRSIIYLSIFIFIPIAVNCIKIKNNSSFIFYYKVTK